MDMAFILIHSHLRRINVNGDSGGGHVWTRPATYGGKIDRPIMPVNRRKTNKYNKNTKPIRSTGSPPVKSC